MGSEEAFHQNVQDIFFDYDSYDLRPDAQAAIAQAASYLAAHPGIQVVIGGYCDDRGSAEYNLALGENRANAARTALVSAGVAASRLRVISYGKEKQFCTEETESCWQQNRRAQFSTRSLTLREAVQPAQPIPRRGLDRLESRAGLVAMSKNMFASHLLIAPRASSPRLRFPARRIAALAICALLLSAAPAFAAVNKDMVQLQTQIQHLQDAVARLQQSNDERMGVMKDLVQQSADSVNKMSVTLDTLQKQMQAQQEAQSGKIDQVSGQIQSLNDSLDEIKARIEPPREAHPGRSEPAAVHERQHAERFSSPAAESSPPDTRQLQQPLAPSPAAHGGRKESPPPDVPASRIAAHSATAEAAAPPPADELYKTALGDYMAAKYALAASEFGDVVKNYPDNPLSGNAYYYQAEIDYRGGHYPAAVKAYDSVLEQYPDSNKVPVSHLHKGMALIALNQKDAGVREFRTPHPALPQLTGGHAGAQQTQRHGRPSNTRTTGRPTAPPE